jgi:hypothetical protein
VVGFGGELAVEAEESLLVGGEDLYVTVREEILRAVRCKSICWVRKSIR